MVLSDTTIFAANLGGLTALGALSGFAAKKLAKIVAAVAGLQLLLLAWLERQQVLSVDWNGLAAWIPSADGIEVTLTDMLLSTGLLGGGFAAGFVFGFQRG